MPRNHASRARAAALGPGEHQLTFQDFIGRLDQLARRAEHPDPSSPAKALFWVVLAMMGLGFLVQASHAATIQSHGEYHSELVSQALFRVAGLMALLVGFHFGPRGMQRFLPILMVAAGLLLVAVFVPGIGRSVNGAHRWVDLGGLRFQPSELARIVLVMWVADRCLRLGDSMHDLRRGILPMLAVALLFFALVLVETDLGGSLLLLICALAVMWVGGARVMPVAVSLLAVGGGTITAATALIPYMRQRVAVFFGHAQNDQVADTFSAISSAGWFGSGLGHGALRNQGVPYLQSDYVFAQIAEEFGLLGMWAALGLALAFLWFSLRLVLSLQGRYEALSAFGLLVSVCLQGMLHFQVVARLAPPKGMTLPFISDGGTSLIVSSLAVGLALGASRARVETPPTT